MKSTMIALVISGCSASQKDEIPSSCEDLSGTICRVAGTGQAGAIESATLAVESPLYAPMDVAVFTDADDFLIADWNNHKIRRVTDGSVETILGTAFLGDGDPDFQEREAPGVDGVKVALNHPTSMEWNPVTEQWLMPSWHNHRLRQWSPDTGLSLVVGADTDINDGNGANSGFSGDGGPAADALMSYPNSIAVHPETGDFWLLDQRNNRLRHITADYSMIDTVAGGDEASFSGDGGPAIDGRFSFGNLKICNPSPPGRWSTIGAEMCSMSRIRPTIVSGPSISRRESSIRWRAPRIRPPNGDCDPSALCYPRDVEVVDDHLYIADTNNNVIRRMNLESGDMEVVVGSFESGPTADNTPALETTLNTPHGIDIAADGTVLIADTYNHQILKVAP